MFLAYYPAWPKVLHSQGTGVWLFCVSSFKPLNNCIHRQLHWHTIKSEFGPSWMLLQSVNFGHLSSGFPVTFQSWDLSIQNFSESPKNDPVRYVANLFCLFFLPSLHFQPESSVTPLLFCLKFTGAGIWFSNCENPSLVPSTHVWQFTSTCKPQLKGKQMSSLPQRCLASHIHIPTQTQIYIIKNEINLEQVSPLITSFITSSPLIYLLCLNKKSLKHHFGAVKLPTTHIKELHNHYNCLQPTVLKTNFPSYFDGT